MIGWVLLFLIGLLGVALILALVRWNPVLLWRIQPMWVWDYVWFAFAMWITSSVVGFLAVQAFSVAPVSPRNDVLEMVFRNGYVVFGLAYWIWSMRLIKPGD